MKTLLEEVLDFLDKDVKLKLTPEKAALRIKWYINTYFIPKEQEQLKNSAPEFIRNIDWRLLREQKARILALTNAGILAKDTCDDLEGVINLIDALQDYAADDMGLGDKVVFDLEEEEE